MSKNAQEVQSEVKKHPPPLTEFLAGLGSAFLTITVTYPITKLIYRQILENTNAVKSYQNIKNEGAFVLYRGCLAPMLQRCIAISTMFGVYRAVRISLDTLHMNEYVEKISACVLVGAFESIFMPLERIQMLLIVSQYNRKFRNMFHVVKIIAKEYSLKEFYRGYTVVLFRNISSNSFFFITKDELHKRFKFSEVAYRQNAQHFMFGATLGTAMTVIFYPLKVAKVNLHKQLGGRFRSVKEVFKAIYKKNGGGILNFYRGVVVNSCRSLISWGLTNSSYEYLKKNLP